VQPIDVARAVGFAVLTDFSLPEVAYGRVTPLDVANVRRRQRVSLQTAYPETTPDSWVSANRRFLLGGHPGDDDLGYDFKISRRICRCCSRSRPPRLTTTSSTFGRSEPGAARQANRGQYRIILIRRVLTPGQQELFVLRNPLEPASSAHFEEINDGVRLRFRPTLALRG
jgi:hypothetical protein